MNLLRASCVELLCSLLVMKNDGEQNGPYKRKGERWGMIIVQETQETLCA